jgi:hypothetical protein
LIAANQDVIVEFVVPLEKRGDRHITSFGVPDTDSGLVPRETRSMGDARDTAKKKKAAEKKDAKGKTAAPPMAAAPPKPTKK